MKNSAIKYRKIRGINRRKRAIEQWGDNRKSLNINLLTQEKRDYVKFRVQPWSRLPLGSSVYPEPTGDCEYLLIKNLQKIYQSWKDSLETLQTPYYLQIWLYEDYISRSQVVCAIKAHKNFYQNTFESVDKQPQNGIQSSIHYNANTAKYLDCHIWQFSRHIEAYDMTDEDSREMVQETDPSKILRTEIINGRKHKIVEINKVWLIS
ncbi:hypothetical protein IQ457_12255 [Psychrobacter sp. M9-54-1]|jgi:hypothetical protein|uniref:hypothetical protein n=1 Tax=Psychrobacter sp. M9-54-1 TaxID=2782386 RepID=UPI00190B26E9|nr:hypothetical protein [Psychrobacter sp. M9-54-1]MBK3394696.1 hypothetical protein [Psychrobacter sp. M9-54-1]